MQDCRFCEYQPLRPLYRVKSYAPNLSEISQYCYPVMTQHTLYYKYSSSQNYHYTKEINEILNNQRTQANVHFNDYLCFDEEDEYLKRMYELQEYDGKVHLLSEFYKFHRDLPRWTVQKKILRVLNYYYDKKRKLEYYKIQRMIEMENRNNPNQPAKGIVGDRPIESCSTPISESSETLNVNYNVENILHEITMLRERSQLVLPFNPPPINHGKVVVPPLALNNSKTNIDVQAMINLLNEQSLSKIEADTDQMIKDTPKNIKLAHHFAHKKTVNEGNLFQKKKIMQKKSLRLDELGLSNDEKMPQSARYQPPKLIDTPRIKGSQTTSRERLSNNEISRDLLKQLKMKHIVKQPNTMRNMSSKSKVKDGFSFKLNPPLSARGQPKKSFNQMIAPTEIKRLEMKVLQGLQEIQRRNLSQKLNSFDQKQLHQILMSYHKQKKVGPKALDSFSLYDSQNFSENQKLSQTPRNPQQPPKPSPSVKVKIGKLDLRKLKSSEYQTPINNRMFPAAESARNESTSRTSQQQKGLKSDRPISKKPQMQMPFPSSITQRNPQLTPRTMDGKIQFNNLMQWQIKAIQAASKKFNLQRK